MTDVIVCERLRDWVNERDRGGGRETGGEREIINKPHVTELFELIIMYIILYIFGETRRYIIINCKQFDDLNFC